VTQFIPSSRDRAFLLPPDAREWLPADDVAHVVVAAVDRVPLGAFAVRPIPGGRAQYHPRRRLALLIDCDANGLFSSRRIERARYRDIGVRYVAADLHPDHDTIAAFRRANRAAFEAAFLQVLLLAKESGLLRLGTVAVDGTRMDANASKIRSLRYDRAKDLRAKLAAGDRSSAAGHIAELTARAEAADAEAQPDPQALPAEIARRCALMRRSDVHDCRQAHNAQAVVCAEGSQRILADTGFASGEAVAALQAQKIEPLVAIGRTRPHRPTTSARRQTRTRRAGSPNPGASPCRPSWKRPMPKPATPAARGRSNPSSASSNPSSASPASTSAASPRSAPSGP
jgi:transposase